MARNIANARLSALKKIGVLSDISNRGNLTDSQKARVREAYKEYEPVITAPKGTYSNVSANKLTASQINSLKEYGIPVVNGRAFVPTSGFQKATLRQTTVLAPGKSRNRFFRSPTSAVEITRKLEVSEGEKKFTKIERELISPIAANSMEARIDEMVRRLGPLKKGEHYAIKTKGNRVYRRGSAFSADSLKTYVFRVGASGSRNVESPLNEEDFFHDIQVVKIKSDNDGFQYDPSEITQKKFQSQKSARSRKRKKTRGRLGK